jgi:hypothetical protein
MVAACLRAVAFASLSLSACHAANRNSVGATYANGRCGGSPKNWQPQGSEFGELMSRNVIGVESGELRWNGSIIGPKTLRRYLTDFPKLDPRPNLVVVFDPQTDCSTVEAVRREVTQSASCGEASACVDYTDAEWRKALPTPP